MRRLVLLFPIAISAGLAAIFWIGLVPKRDKNVLPSALIASILCDRKQFYAVCISQRLGIGLHRHE